MCLRLGIDLRLFHFLVEHDGVPVSALQLAEQSQAEVLLVGTQTMLDYHNQDLLDLTQHI